MQKLLKEKERNEEETIHLKKEREKKIRENSREKKNERIYLYNPLSPTLARSGLFFECQWIHCLLSLLSPPLDIPTSKIRIRKRKREKGERKKPEETLPLHDFHCSNLNVMDSMN